VTVDAVVVDAVVVDAVVVDAVVVDHHAGELLSDCVESLVAAGANRVVVVDNSVPPGHSKNVLARFGSRVEIFEPGVNLGYGSGANRGAATCDSELVLICNADVVVRPDALGRLSAAIRSDRGVGIAGPLILDADGRRYPSARRFPDLVEAAGHALGGLMAPGNRFTRRYRMEELSTGTDGTRRESSGSSSGTDSAESTVNVDWVSGSCILVRRSAFEELGGFDESYFMYGEDVDLCWRAHQAGWGVAYVPGASVTHVRAVSTRKRPYAMLAAHHRSALRFASRSLKGPRRLVLPAVAAALGARLAFEAARQVISGRGLGTPPAG
jgi:N-acetylglucosaminyl-diphospho-decaprenol L-rhamnosyltransferase